MKSFSLLILVISTVLTVSIMAQKPYKGNAILGNGNVCLVYSDDERITARTGFTGIQHLYFGDYTVDYVKSSSVYLRNKKTGANYSSVKKTVSMSDFYKPSTTQIFANGADITTECMVAPNDVILLKVRGTKCKPSDFISVEILFRKLFTGYKNISLIGATTKNNYAVLKWDNGTILALQGSEKMKFSSTDSSIVINAEPGKEKQCMLYLVPALTEKDALLKLKTAQKKDFEKSISTYWESWIAKSATPEIVARADKAMFFAYKQTLYAVKAACLNGMIPADMTGQFLTNNMPQLYPRDAMKSARVFLTLGYREEAKAIISFWCGNIPKKSKGEFYARYDARAIPVDGGSGARFDEPEWDANGYLTQLLQWYFNKYGEWLAPKEFIYELSDFVCSKIDDSGLLYEGGIVEWTGYLPTTNMVCAAGLSTAAKIAEQSNDSLHAQKYSAAARQISDNLFKTFDLEKNSYMAVRFHGVKDDNKSLMEKTGDKLFLWDGTMHFGALWGYPIHPMLQSTIRFYEENILKPEGGLQYFEAMDKGFLSQYGGDLFIFSTAALSQYYAMHGQKEKALHQIQWMIANANIYGLMPERIYVNYSDCADASPLTWCNAEFAAAVYTYLNN